MKSKLIKLQNIVMILGIISIITYIIFLYPLDTYDESWNFQNIIKMCNGFKIYKDANIIITPVFFFVGVIFCKIFNNNIIGFRIYNAIICITLCLTIYKIFNDLKIPNKFLKLFVSIIFEFIIITIIGNGANYNTLSILAVLFGMRLYINKKTNNLLQGAVIGIIFLIKQNVGVYYAISVLIYELYKNKSGISYIKDQLTKFLGFSIVFGIFLAFMNATDNLYYFINYVFGGIFDFSKNNLIFTASAYYYFMLIAVIALYIFICIQKDKIFKKIITDEVFDNITLIFIFSIIMTLIAFPLVNDAHFSFCVILYLIFVFYYFTVLLLEEIFDEDKYIVGINWVTIIILMCVVCRIYIPSLLSYMNNNIKYISDENSHFYGFWRENTDSIENIKNYIIEKNSKGIDVIVCSYEAAMVMIDLNQSHGAYDLPFNGNLGYDGVNRMEQDILSKKNTEFLIFTDEEDMFWQESKEIRNCIINNLNYVGDIENYSIYSTEEQ